MKNDVFAKTKDLLADEACLVVRVDNRRFTLSTTIDTLYGLWPSHRLFGRASRSNKPTQTSLFGDKTIKPGDIDIIMLSKGRHFLEAFAEIKAFS